MLSILVLKTTTVKTNLSQAHAAQSGIEETKSLADWYYMPRLISTDYPFCPMIHLAGRIPVSEES
jgi:hypothetical protein